MKGAEFAAIDTRKAT